MFAATLTVSFSEAPALNGFVGTIEEFASATRPVVDKIENGPVPGSYAKTNVLVSVAGIEYAVRFDVGQAFPGVLSQLQAELDWKNEQVKTGGPYAKYIKPDTIRVLTAILALIG